MRRYVVPVAMVLLVGLAPSSAAGPGTAAGGERLDDAVVDAVVVRSWHSCNSDGLAWAEINDRWDELGATEVHIEYDYAPLCSGPVTYEALVARDADVLIVSHPALSDGAPMTASETAAVQRYVEEGHGLVASGELNDYWEGGVLELQPLLGIRRVYQGMETFSRTFAQEQPHHPVFTDVARPYQTDAQFTQAIRGGLWQRKDLTPSARYLAKSTDQRAAIVANRPAAGRTLYISSLPEAIGERAAGEPNADDLQLVYNAIVWTAR